VPVLFDEVMAALLPHDGGVYIDATVAPSAGHAEVILERSGPGGRLLAWMPTRKRCTGRRRAWRPMTNGWPGAGRHHDLAAWRGRAVLAGCRILLDLGVSSLQLDDPARGFSFQADGPLDMRMGPDVPLTAEEIIQHLAGGRAGPRDL
jgi:16S rRNA (cytosine1402-N4)-methyltransferase